MHKNKTTFYLGLSILVILLAFAFISPLFLNIDPNKQNLLNTLAPMSSNHILGTDQYGRDVFTRLVYGAKLSFILAFITMISASLFGTFLGLIAAFKQGIIDKLINIFASFILALPGLLLVLLLIAFSPGNFLFIYLGLALSLWIEFFKVVRSKTHTILVQPYVEASRLLGFNSFYIFKKHIFKKIIPSLVTLCSFSMSTAVIAISTLSAISVGLRPPTAELGSMIVELFPYYEEAPLLMIYPSIIIFFIVLSLQLISKGFSNE